MEETKWPVSVTQWPVWMGVGENPSQGVSDSFLSSLQQASHPGIVGCG